MSPLDCAVNACAKQPDDELIVALGGMVTLAGVCAEHGDEIRSGRQGVRPSARRSIPSAAAEAERVGLELLPAGV